MNKNLPVESGSDGWSETDNCNKTNAARQSKVMKPRARTTNEQINNNLDTPTNKLTKASGWTTPEANRLTKQSHKPRLRPPSNKLTISSLSYVNVLRGKLRTAELTVEKLLRSRWSG